MKNKRLWKTTGSKQAGLKLKVQLGLQKIFSDIYEKTNYLSGAFVFPRAQNMGYVYIIMGIRVYIYGDVFL